MITTIELVNDYKYKLKDLYERNRTYNSIGEELKVHENTIARAINILIDEGFIIKRKRVRSRMKCSNKAKQFRSSEKQLVNVISACLKIGMTIEEIAKENAMSFKRVRELSNG